MFILTNLFLKKKEYIIGESKFGTIDIVVAIRKENVFGTQFHLKKVENQVYYCLKNFIYLIERIEKIFY